MKAVENQPGQHGKALDDPESAIAELGGERNIVVDVHKPEGDAQPHEFETGALELPTYDARAARSRRGRRTATRCSRSARRDGEVVALDGEVSNSTHADEFAKEIPERYFEMYIAEQQLVAAAVGLQVRKWKPFASTFAAFFSRAYDFVRMAAISRADIRLSGSHAGVSIGEDGPSQMALEDLAAFRAVHGSTVLYPSDANQTAKLVAAMADLDGISFIRTTRGATPVIYDAGEEFPIGGAKVVREGDDVTLVGAGITLHEALKAADALAERGDLGARGRPLLREAGRRGRRCAKRSRRRSRRIVVVEDHWPEGGLGETVLSALAGEELAVRAPRGARDARLGQAGGAARRRRDRRGRDRRGGAQARLRRGRRALRRIGLLRLAVLAASAPVLAACDGKNDDAKQRGGAASTRGNAPVVVREFLRQAGSNGRFVPDRRSAGPTPTSQLLTIITKSRGTGSRRRSNPVKPLLGGHTTGRDREAETLRCRKRKASRAQARWTACAVSSDLRDTLTLRSGCYGVLDQGASAAAAHGLGRREHAAAGQELDPRRGADLAAVRRSVAPRLQLRLERRREERRLGARRRRVALARTRVGDRLRQRHPLVERSKRICSTVVMIVEPPGEPSARNGLLFFSTIVGAIELRGRLPPSARFGCVAESKLKSVSSLLSRKPQPGTRMPGAAGRLDRERVGDDVAPLVRGDEMRRRLGASSPLSPDASVAGHVTGTGRPAGRPAVAAVGVISARRVAA